MTSSIIDKLRNPTDAMVWAIMAAMDEAPVRRDRGFSNIKVALAKFADLVEKKPTMVSEQAIPILDELMHLGAVIEPIGSRVTCNPAPTDTDEDYLVFCTNETIVSEVVGHLGHSGFKWEGDEHYQDAAQNTFMSWRKGSINLIVTASPYFKERHRVATKLCQRLNLLNKADRIAVFQAVLYGKEA